MLAGRTLAQLVRVCCGSMSAVATRNPACAAATARLRAVIVLPAPPFGAASRILFMLSPFEPQQSAASPSREVSQGQIGGTHHSAKDHKSEKFSDLPWLWCTN